MCLFNVQVKVWCTKQEASVLNIDMKANICCVKYNPGSGNYIAVCIFNPFRTRFLVLVHFELILVMQLSCNLFMQQPMCYSG